MNKTGAIEQGSSPCEFCGNPSVIVLDDVPLCSRHSNTYVRDKADKLKSAGLNRPELIQKTAESLTSGTDR